ncbi:hypothetical protein LIA77_01549 [Sarocladium implicatum]|nr:hypothetical protein LIA77_01549 [Sarocladium implicatum]
MTKLRPRALPRRSERAYYALCEEQHELLARSWIENLVGEGIEASPESSIVFSGVSIIIPSLTSPQTAENVTQNGFIHVTSRTKYYKALEAGVRGCLSTSRQTMSSLLMETEETAEEAL